MKFDFFYYVVYNIHNQTIGTYFEEDFSENLVPEGGGYEMRYYEGCPAHSS